MVKPDAYSAAQELGQALSRAEAAEEELRQRTIELENAHGTCNRLQIELGAARADLLRIECGLRDVAVFCRAMCLHHDVVTVLKENGLWREAEEAQAG